jgi:hypothetical protein
VLNLVKTTVPKSTESLVFELGSKAFLDLRTGFRAAEVAAGTPVRFQVSICAPPKVDVSKIEFTSLRIGFSDDLPDLVVTNGGLERVVDVGTVTAQSAPQVTAPLTFKTGEPLVLTGDLVGAVGEVSVSDVVLCLQHESWSIELRLLPRPLYMWTAGGTTYAPLSGLFPNVAFTPRPHDVRLDVQSAQIAFVGEKSPITVRVTSTDERPLGLTLSAALQDAEGGQLSHGSDSGAELRDIPVKLVDGAAEVTLSLTSSEPGSVVVELALTSTAHKDTSEIAHTVVVPVLAPFECAPTISRSGTHATVSAVIRVPARKITVTALEIDSHAEGVTLVSSSLSAVRLPLEWDASTSFALAARFRLQTLTQRAAAPPGAAAVIRVKWRPDGASDTDDEITTLLPLPPLASARPEAFVTATLATPTVVNAHTPFPLTLTVANAHPTDAAFVTVSGETAEGFVWTGPRGARVGPVPAGGTASVAFEAVPVGIAGWQALPHLGVWHGEGQDRREVRINVTQDRVVGTVLVQP